jgi:hypothetical protein
MLSLVFGIALNGCMACAQPMMPGIEALPERAGPVELVKHKRKHFVKTKRAWRHCRAKYGKRLVSAYESSTKWRCIYRVKRR